MSCVKVKVFFEKELKHTLVKLKEGFLSLKGSPSELWKAYLLKFLDSFSYFSFSLIFTLFLSADFGYSDLSAGTIYGAYGALIGVFGLCMGVVIDILGVSLSLKVGYIISLFARCLIFVTNSRILLLVSVTILALGNCLGIPVLTVGIRRYTTEANRGFAFGLFYVIMNVAVLLSGPTVDFCTIVYKGGGNKDYENDVEINNNEWEFSGYRLVILVGILANIATCIVSFTIKEINIMTNVKNDSEDQELQGYDNYPSSQQSPVIISFQQTAKDAIVILKDTLRTKSFWRFCTVCIIMINVRMVFRHLDATLPKYMVREFGENVPKGTIYSINPALIIILVPIITAATSKVDPLIMVYHGSYISAASVFALAFSTSIPSCITFVVFLSIGEAIWSPRLYDYSMKICKEGREGTYMALSSAPIFLAKLPVGFMSGYLLQNYCPEDGPRESRIMWLIIGLITTASPVLLTIFWGYISKTDDSRGQYKYSPVNDGVEL